MSTYKSTTSQDVSLLNSYSTVSSSSWWKEAAEQVVLISHDFNDVRLVLKFVLSLDPTIAASLLFKRWKDWLDAFLNVLCRDKVIEKPLCNSLLFTAKAIVAIIRQRPLSPIPEENGKLMFLALISLINIIIIA